MAETGKPLEIERVACEVCLKEIPVSDATSEEVMDYVTYFCGLECYEQWKKQIEQNKQ